VTTYVALLRGVNVGGKSVGMASLRAGLAAMGLTDVRTYLQSGNVVFSAGETDPQALAAAIAERIAGGVGLDIGVLVLTAAELRDVAAANPFLVDGTAAVDERHLHATFLFESPLEGAFAGLDLPAAEGERAALAGRVIYLHLPHGYGRTKLSNGYFERKLRSAATTRNWRTVLALNGMVAGR
jgi:uncharacterized protein (DUF1697 family)